MILTGQVGWSTLWEVDTYNIHEAKAQFSRIMRSVEEGHAVLIARDGVVIARILPEPRPARIRLGRDAGRAAIGPDFDAPLPEFDEYTRG
jgi:prevent-host-death family protein